MARRATDRSEALRLKGPPVETIKLEAEIDATDRARITRAERQTRSRSASSRSSRRSRRSCIPPARRSAGERRAAPERARWRSCRRRRRSTLFIWSKNRIVPVRLTDFSITEEAFDPTLNPIRAKVSLGMRVLSVDDLGFDAQGRRVCSGLPAAKEQLAATACAGGRRHARARRNSMSDPLRALILAGRRRGLQPVSGQTAAITASPRPADHADGRRSRVSAPARSCRRRNASRCCRNTRCSEGDRLDNVAAKYIGDPEQFWRVCRRQRRHAAGRIDGDRRRADLRSPCPKDIPRDAQNANSAHSSARYDRTRWCRCRCRRKCWTHSNIAR